MPRAPKTACCASHSCTAIRFYDTGIKYSFGPLLQATDRQLAITTNYLSSGEDSQARL